MQKGYRRRYAGKYTELSQRPSRKNRFSPLATPRTATGLKVRPESVDTKVSG